MAPSKFLHNNISSDECFSNVNWMVASDLVVCDSLVLTLVTIGVKFGLWQLFFEPYCGPRRFLYSRLNRILRHLSVLVFVLFALFSFLFLLVLTYIFSLVDFRTFSFNFVILTPSNFVLFISLPCRIEANLILLVSWRLGTSLLCIGIFSGWPTHGCGRRHSLRFFVLFDWQGQKEII